MITAYTLFIYRAMEWRYAGTAWTVQAAEDVIRTYRARGWTGRYVAQGRR
jgi:hypothetical protein